MTDWFDDQPEGVTIQLIDKGPRWAAYAQGKHLKTLGDVVFNNGRYMTIDSKGVLDGRHLDKLASDDWIIVNSTVFYQELGVYRTTFKKDLK